MEETFETNDEYYDLIKRHDGNNFTYNPYNLLNKEITKEEILAILREFNLPAFIDNIELYKRAFIHRSYLTIPKILPKQLGNGTGVGKIYAAACPPGCIALKTKSNERLEFVGDGILSAITTQYLYKRFPNQAEGFMTSKKIALIKNEHLGKICINLGLNKWYIVSKYAENNGIRGNVEKMGCLFEAFLGALFLDMNKLPSIMLSKYNYTVTNLGFQVATSFIEGIFECNKYIDWTALIMEDDNYKNIFQEKIQKIFKQTPYYVQIPVDKLNTYDHRYLPEDLDQNDVSNGKFIMGVYYCFGQSIYSTNIDQSIHIKQIGHSIQDVLKYTEEHERGYICIGIGQHNIKKKAEQFACKNALLNLNL